MKRLLKYIFIPVLAVLLMSHNTFAVTTVYDLSNYDIIVNQVYSSVDCNISGTVKDDVRWCFVNNSSGAKQLNKLVTHNSFTLKKDDIVEFDVINVTPDSLTSISNFNYVAMKPNDTTNFRMITTNQVSSIYGDTSYVVNGTVYHWGHVNSVMRMTYKVINDSYIPIGVISTDPSNNPSATWTQGVSGLMWNIVDLTIYRKSGNSDINQEQEQATQNAANNSSTSANNNSTNQTTSNLLGVFGSFVAALTSISPSNCNVDFDLGHIDFGVQNLCSQPVPQAFTVVTSIIVVCFTIPFVVHLVKRIFGLIREMQS